MKLIRFILSFLPTALPVGLTSFHKWSEEIIELGGKYADIDSLKFALASMIQHLPHGQKYVSKQYFVRSLHKAAANQIAAQVFLDIKEKQAAAAAAKTAEVTAQPESVTSDAQVQNS